MRVTVFLLLIFFLTACSQTEEYRLQNERVQLPKRIYFEFDSVHLKNLDKEYPKVDYAHLSDEAEKTLSKLAKWLRENPDTDILLEGHTDEYGIDVDNVFLGEVYTRLAKDFLEDHGISDKRISILSYGEERPLDFRMDEHSQMMNNRFEFNIL